MDLAATFEVPPVFEIVASPAQSEYPVTKTPIHLLRANFIESTREITEYAAERNVDIAIEPINRFEGYAGFLNSLVEGKGIVDEIDAPNLGVLADFFHVNMEDGPLNDALRAAATGSCTSTWPTTTGRLPGPVTSTFWMWCGLSTP